MSGDDVVNLNDEPDVLDDESVDEVGDLVELDFEIREYHEDDW